MRHESATIAECMNLIGEEGTLPFSLDKQKAPRGGACGAKWRKRLAVWLVTLTLDPESGFVTATQCRRISDLYREEA